MSGSDVATSDHCKVIRNVGTKNLRYSTALQSSVRYLYHALKLIANLLSKSSDMQHWNCNATLTIVTKYK
jgi:hypothetical protein